MRQGATDEAVNLAVRQWASRPQLKRIPLDGSPVTSVSRCAIVALALSVPSSVGAQDSVPAACDNMVTTLDMRRCSSANLAAAERELRRVVEEARSQAGRPALLDSAQASWEQYRNLACRAAGSQYDGGSMLPLVVLECRLRLANDRIRTLREDYLQTNVRRVYEPKPYDPRELPSN